MVKTRAGASRTQMSGLKATRPTVPSAEQYDDEEYYDDDEGWAQDGSYQEKGGDDYGPHGMPRAVPDFYTDEVHLSPAQLNDWYYDPRVRSLATWYEGHLI